MQLDDLQKVEDEPREWERHVDYLHERTPLAKRQAEVLALRKAGATRDQIATVLDISANTVKNHWAEVLNKLDQSQEFRTVMGPHPWGNNEGWTDECDRSLWELRSHASFQRENTPNRTRIEMELYRGSWNVTSHDYLFVMREIVDVEDWATETTETRGAHEVNGLRSHIYQNAETVTEYYICWELLAHAGIDPGADYAPRPESVLGTEVSEAETTEAKETAKNIVASTSGSW